MSDSEKELEEWAKQILSLNFDAITEQISAGEAVGKIADLALELAKRIEY